MTPKKISINVIKDMKPGETVWDSEIKGLGCRCQKDSKTFVLKYREGKGRAARQWLYTLGKLGSPWTPEMARNEAKRILGRVANGENPAAERKNAKTASNVNDAFELFIKDGKGKRGPTTEAEYRRMYERHIKSELGKYRVQDVKRIDITRLHNELSDTKALANRLLQMLSALFYWCEKQQFIADGSNPCRHIDKYKEQPRERFLSETEIYGIGEALAQYEKEHSYLKEMSHKINKTGDTRENKVTTYITAAIRLLIFTGARRGEILNLQWKDIDFERKLIRLQKSKTGQKTIYLSAPALEILNSIPVIEGNPYVICGRNDGSQVVNLKDPWRRICRMATIGLWKQNPALAKFIESVEGELAKGTRVNQFFEAIEETSKAKGINLPEGVTDVHIHDLRHNYASTAVTAGHHLKVIGSLLGHANTKTTERYAHLANDPLQIANEAVGRKILEAMHRPVKRPNIIALKG